MSRPGGTYSEFYLSEKYYIHGLSIKKEEKLFISFKLRVDCCVEYLVISQKNMIENIKQCTGEWDGAVLNLDYFTPVVVARWILDTVYQQSRITVQNYPGGVHPKHDMQWETNVYT
jgi:hypothetical protein